MFGSRRPLVFDAQRLRLPAGVWCWRRRALLLQFLGTVVALGWISGDWAKLATMAVFWAIGFGRLSPAEVTIAVVVDLLFVAMDEAALKQRIFAFRHPDVGGLPIYEYFLWGFYILHAVRFLGGPGGHPRRMLWALGLAAAFSLCFSTITNPLMLALTAGAVLVASLGIFHEPTDLAFTAYMAAMGMAVEYVGVATGQWSYPHAPLGGVPLWSFVMWCGVGIFSSRLLVPFLRKSPLPLHQAATDSRTEPRSSAPPRVQ